MGRKAVIRELFIRYAAGRSTVAERAELLTYLQEEPSEDVIPHAAELQIGERFDKMTAAESDSIFQHIVAQPVAPKVVPMRRYRRWLGAAAIFIPFLAIAALSYYYYGKQRGMLTYTNTTGTVRTITLADGTRIHLNRQSNIRMRQRPPARQPQDIWLEGEAFFDIAPDANRRFTVHAAQLDISNLGTAFNVNTNAGSPVVILNSGAVKVAAVKTGANKTMILRPGEAAFFDGAKGTLTVQPTDTLFHTAWKYNLLPFKAVTLEGVLSQIAQHYDIKAVKFLYAPTKYQQFTGYLASNNLEQALVTLEEVFNLKITTENNNITVNKKHPN